MAEDTPSGLARRELFVDARDLQSDADPDNPLTPEEYAAVLTVRGEEMLTENQLVQSFSTVVRTLAPPTNTVWTSSSATRSRRSTSGRASRRTPLCRPSSVR